MPRSTARSTIGRMASTPAAWPSASGTPRWRAQRRLPSMMMATWRGSAAASVAVASDASDACARSTAATRPPGSPAPWPCRRGPLRRSSGRSASGGAHARGAPRRRRSRRPSRGFELIERLAAMVADLDARLFHPLVDELDQVLAALLGERRDVEAHDRAVDVGRQADVALQDGLLDGAQDAAGPTAG